MNNISPQVDQQYHALVQRLFEERALNPISEDRTGAGRFRLFGETMKFDLDKGFPLLQSKKTYASSIIKELGWFGKGSTNISDLGCSIWDEWHWDEDDTDVVRRGDIGPMYGKQWVDCPTVNNKGEVVHINQLKNVIDELKYNPDSSRLVVSSWNPGTLPRSGFSVKENIGMGNMGLAPCHFAFQLFSKVDRGERVLDLMWHQRSADVLVGLPFNIASYGSLLKLIGNEVGMRARTLVGTLGDTHMYGNHVLPGDQFLRQSGQFLSEYKPTTPVELNIPEHVNIWNLHQHVEEVLDGIQNYNPQPFIKFERN